MFELESTFDFKWEVLYQFYVYSEEHRANFIKALSKTASNKTLVIPFDAA
jgi:hypothetical protein